MVDFSISHQLAFLSLVSYFSAFSTPQLFGISMPTTWLGVSCGVSPYLQGKGRPSSLGLSETSEGSTYDTYLSLATLAALVVISACDCAKRPLSREEGTRWMRPVETPSHQ